MYIGEKGIGFKSVFMAAWKVHIQSGYFSFSFVHRKGDSGMGMVRPMWEEAKEDLPHPLTRITLFLHDYEDPTQHRDMRAAIRKEFREIQAPMLLFFRHIKAIDVRIYDDDARQEHMASFRLQNGKLQNQKILETTEASGDATIVSSESQIYHVQKHTVTDLPRNENRTLSADEEASRSYAKSEILLAFPLTANSEPIVKPQKVFAFLPMRQMGFNVSYSRSEADRI